MTWVMRGSGSPGMDSEEDPNAEALLQEVLVTILKNAPYVVVFAALKEVGFTLTYEAKKDADGPVTQ